LLQVFTTNDQLVDIFHASEHIQEEFSDHENSLQCHLHITSIVLDRACEIITQLPPVLSTIQDNNSKMAHLARLALESGALHAVTDLSDTQLPSASSCPQSQSPLSDSNQALDERIQCASEEGKIASALATLWVAKNATGSGLGHHSSVATWLRY
jgi:hypothetical protein